jgi:hypothetical protein
VDKVEPEDLEDLVGMERKLLKYANEDPVDAADRLTNQTLRGNSFG